MRYSTWGSDSYISTKSTFAEYTRFEDDAKVRAATKQDFVEGLIRAPKYKYPKLDMFMDPDDSEEFIHDKEDETRDLISKLEAHRKSGQLSSVECDLNIDFYKHRLTKIMLVEAAARMRHAASPRAQQAATRRFMSLNSKLYGTMDIELFNGMMATEQQRVAEFAPKNARARAIKQSLEAYFIIHPYTTPEPAVIGAAMLARLQKTMTERYRAVLGVVPATDDTVTYNARQCQEILQDALAEGGLSQLGWQVVVDRAKSNPSTNVDEKIIYLPADTLRTASQLRRLIIHEQEVHARRGQNGITSGVTILAKGTAGYAAVEEGLGVLLECALEGTTENQSYYRARDRYLTAGVALGLDGNLKDGRATFGLIWRLIALRLSAGGNTTAAIEREAKVLAMQHTENAFRGTNFAMPGIIYTKLKVYYEGLLKNAAYFTSQAANDLALDQALRGKYNHCDYKERRTVDKLAN